MDLVTLMTLKLTAQQVGTDQFGNRYYEERRARPGKPPRRYVRYNGIAEASKVPADWHGWLHHTEATPPPEGGYNKHDWQQEHQPNVTGQPMLIARKAICLRAESARRQQAIMSRGTRRKSSDYLGSGSSIAIPLV